MYNPYTYTEVSSIKNYFADVGTYIHTHHCLNYKTIEILSCYMWELNFKSTFRTSNTVG